MAYPAQPLDGNYKPVGTGLYDPVGKQFVAQQAGTVATSSDGTPYAPLSIHQVIGTPITASATGAAAASATATLAGTSGKTTYITGFTVTSGNPASTVVGLVTITGCSGGTLNFQFTESSSLGGELLQTFPIPIPASAPNTSIVVTVPAITSGAVVAVTAYGYQL